MYIFTSPCEVWRNTTAKLSALSTLIPIIIVSGEHYLIYLTHFSQNYFMESTLIMMLIYALTVQRLLICASTKEEYPILQFEFIYPLIFYLFDKALYSTNFDENCIIRR